MKIYSSQEIADEFGCSKFTVIKWCGANNVSYIGKDRRKEYQISEADKEKFNARNKSRGRPSKKNV